MRIFGTKHHFVYFCFANATIALMLTLVNSMDRKSESTLLETVNFKDHLLNVNISMTVGQIFTKICIFIENRQIFMLLNCNCAKLANFEDF